MAETKGTMCACLHAGSPIQECTMPGKRQVNSQIKDEEQYEALRKQGASKEKAARIANASRSRAAKRGGKSAPYEDWRKADLYQQARKIGISGRSRMSKPQLIHALRNH
jgi:hypothetical protein